MYCALWLLNSICFISKYSVINVLSSILTDLFSLPMMTPLTAFSALNIYGEQMSDSQHD